MDWNLQRFALPDGSTLPVDPEIVPRGEIMQAITLNGSAEHQRLKAIQESVSTEGPEWSKRIAISLILDIITIACIAWLLLR